MRDMKTGPSDVSAAPKKTQTWFDQPRPLTDFVTDGQVDEGCEANGTVFPDRVVSSLNRSLATRQPAEFKVIGEARYSDGSHFLDFGISQAFVEATTDYRFIPGRFGNPVLVCPDCEGVDGQHHKITITSQRGIPELVKCPKDSRHSFGRSS